MGRYYKGELPTEFNGITMEEADRLASEFLQNEPCNRMWDAIRALRDFYEDIKTFSVEIKIPHGRLVEADEVYARAEHEKEFIGDIKKDDFPMYVDWILSKSFTYINAEYNHI